MSESATTCTWRGWQAQLPRSEGRSAPSSRAMARCARRPIATTPTTTGKSMTKDFERELVTAPGLGTEVQERVFRWLAVLDPSPAQPQLLAAAHQLAAYRQPTVPPVGGGVGAWGLDRDIDRDGVGDTAVDVETGELKRCT